jgi:serine/threonine protein kinase
MLMLSQAQPLDYELCSGSADQQPGLQFGEGYCDQAPAEKYAEDHELDAEWLSAQLGASVGCSHRIVRHLASGGMSHVFVAEHAYLGAQAAVKVPRYADATGRFIIEAEAKLLARLAHPHIVRALDVGQLADGRVYLLMEHALGAELGVWLEAGGTMPFERCVTVLKQVASAVDYLHIKGIVHGDIKPANILVDASADDFVKLIDFGVASPATRDERRGAIGTPAYMAPEQARGEGWGPLSDVYAVAALALQMLTGHPPHDHHTAQDVLTAMLTQPAPTPSALGLHVPGLDAVFRKGLHHDPAQRFARAGEFVNALSEVLRSEERVPVAAESGMYPVVVAARPANASDAPAVGRVGQPLGWAWNERVARRLAACLVATVYLFSMYG